LKTKNLTDFRFRATRQIRGAAVAQEAASRRAAYLNSRRRGLYRLEVFLVLLYEPGMRPRTSTSLSNLLHAPLEALRGWLSANRTIRLLDRELETAVDSLNHKAEMFEAQLVEIGPQRLSQREAAFRSRQPIRWSGCTATSLDNRPHPPND
jgi:hypothetical protein